MTTENHSAKASSSLLLAILAAVGASLCCVGPLVLVALGISGAWIAQLTAMEPYRPLFIALTLIFLALAFRKLYLLPRRCSTDQPCADDAVQRHQRWLFWIASIGLLALLTFPYYGIYILG